MYTFSLNVANYASLAIDGAAVVTPGNKESAGQTLTGTATLKAGLHRIAIHFQAGLWEWWLDSFYIPPGGQLTLLDGAVLRPH